MSSSEFMRAFYCQEDQKSVLDKDEEMVLKNQLKSIGLPCKAIKLTDKGYCLLNLSGTGTSSLSPLISLPLTHLCLQGCFKIKDFSSLKKMDLIWLNLSRTNIVNLLPLKKLPLIYLRLWRTQVDNLSPLKCVPLRSIDIRFSKVSDLSPLRSVSLEEIFFFPGSISKGLDAIFNMKTLKRINGRDAQVFWRRHKSKLKVVGSKKQQI